MKSTQSIKKTNIIATAYELSRGDSRIFIQRDIKGRWCILPGLMVDEELFNEGSFVFRGYVHTKDLTRAHNAVELLRDAIKFLKTVVLIEEKKEVKSYTNDIF